MSLEQLNFEISKYLPPVTITNTNIMEETMYAYFNTGYLNPFPDNFQHADMVNVINSLRYFRNVYNENINNPAELVNIFQNILYIFGKIIEPNFNSYLNKYIKKYYKDKSEYQQYEMINFFYNDPQIQELVKKIKQNREDKKNIDILSNLLEQTGLTDLTGKSTDEILSEFSRMSITQFGRKKNKKRKK